MKYLEEADVWRKGHQKAPTPDQAVQNDGQDEENDDDAENDSNNDDEDDKYEARNKSQMERTRLRNTYNSARIQNQMLQRFTTLESDVTKTRMLAVTRSTKQTRFLFHARDTALFYGERWGCFSSGNRQLWENTVQAQRLHAEDDEEAWDNTLAVRYGLGLMMGTKGFSIGGLQPTKLIRRAVEVLFKSTSPNAFFPGQLDHTNKQPMLFYRDQFRHFYFHGSFEVPYILHTHAHLVCRYYKGEPVDPPTFTLSPPNSFGINLLESEAIPLATVSAEHQRREAPSRDPAQ